MSKVVAIEGEINILEVGVLAPGVVLAEDREKVLAEEVAEEILEVGARKDRPCIRQIAPIAGKNARFLFVQAVVGLFFVTLVLKSVAMRAGRGLMGSLLKDHALETSRQTGKCSTRRVPNAAENVRFLSVQTATGRHIVISVLITGVTVASLEAKTMAGQISSLR